MKQTARSGFTLIELLVVITIMAVIGTVTLANFGDFGEDQNLKSAVLDVQSQLRAAQANATTNLKCNTQSSATWQVEYAADKKTMNLNCQEPSASPIIKKTLTLGVNIEIQSVSETVSGSGSSCPSALPFTISFAPLNGKIDFIDGTGAVATNCTSLTITLRNTKISPDCNGANAAKCKSLNIDQGGRIYGQ